MILRLKESKTDPFRKGIDIKLFKIDGSICPFSALRKYLSVRKTKFVKMSPMDPLFVTYKQTIFLGYTKIYFAIVRL